MGLTEMAASREGIRGRLALAVTNPPLLSRYGEPRVVAGHAAWLPLLLRRTRWVSISASGATPVTEILRVEVVPLAGVPKGSWTSRVVHSDLLPSGVIKVNKPTFFNRVRKLVWSGWLGFSPPPGHNHTPQRHWSERSPVRNRLAPRLEKGMTSGNVRPETNIRHSQGAAAHAVRNMCSWAVTTGGRRGWRTTSSFCSFAAELDIMSSYHTVNDNSISIIEVLLLYFSSLNHLFVDI